MRKQVLTIMTFLVAGLVSAQDSSKITVAADSSSGTYKQVLGEIIEVCNGPSLDIEVASGVAGGAVGNLDALFNNRAQAAFLHSDVFAFNSQSDPSYNKLKALAWLFPEQIHVIVLRQTKSFREEKSFGGLRTTQIPVDFATLSDVKGFNVGAAGGGWVTIRVLKGAGAEFNPVEFSSGAEVVQALSAGQIAAAIFVGAAPLPNVAKLDPKIYKVIPVGSSIGDRLKNTYRDSHVNYPGLTNGSIATLAPVSVLMTRQFTTPQKVSAQKALRNCLVQKLSVFHDEKSRYWQDVESVENGLASPTLLTFGK